MGLAEMTLQGVHLHVLSNVTRGQRCAIVLLTTT